MNGIRVLRKVAASQRRNFSVNMFENINHIASVRSKFYNSTSEKVTGRLKECVLKVKACLVFLIISLYLLSYIFIYLKYSFFSLKCWFILFCCFKISIMFDNYRSCEPHLPQGEWWSGRSWHCTHRPGPRCGGCPRWHREYVLRMEQGQEISEMTDWMSVRGKKGRKFLSAHFSVLCVSTMCFLLVRFTRK